MDANIKRFIGDAALRRDEIGESPCEVHSFQRGKELYFLKTSPAVYAETTYSVLREAAVLQWLSGRINVPEVMLTAQDDQREYMITRAVPGKPLAALIETKQPVLDLFTESLRQVQSVSIANCPFDSTAAVRLRELEFLVSQGLIDEDFDFDQWPGLHTPQDLLARLHATMPQEDLVFSHGDLGDSNIFVTDHDELHFIDLGRGGKADRWLDIAFVHRNLSEEISAASARKFLAQLPFPDAPQKREFFEQLDELF
ncbi:APH(3') family aminoglycoside O-phosphotransferase [Pseudoduganella sp. FT55W]|uniref:Aminoglycoside 3'-phosphotransferase n=1 Tax=Duganella rivi TaxID=2666083 RepID=A0A7X4GMM8_9BURK|nr:APH(3') family aminoglycoside O-phosphotransferase [Duganella rivi]MYM65825.1 APH(3') family aminoglycoside O-phosphotransferase [Duganella rivi]